MYLPQIEQCADLDTSRALMSLPLEIQCCLQEGVPRLRKSIESLRAVERDFAKSIRRLSRTTGDSRDLSVAEAISKCQKESTALYNWQHMLVDGARALLVRLIRVRFRVISSTELYIPIVYLTYSYGTIIIQLHKTPRQSRNGIQSYYMRSTRVPGAH